MDLFEDHVTIKQGAEGKLYKGTYLGRRSVIKERFKKLYRFTDLDDQLTRERMKAECKAILKSKTAGVQTPAIFLVDFDQRLIVMEEIESSITAKDYINKIIESSEEDLIVNQKLDSISCEIGSAIGKIHKQGIVHGDLTTSNMLIREDGNGNVLEFYLIDFGLSQLDASVEDKAVDLYVLERALDSTHKNSKELLRRILVAYSNIFKKKDCKEVMNKLDEVRARGRKRTMVG